VLKEGAKDIRIDWEHTEYRFIRPSELRDYETVPHLEQSLSGILVGPKTESGLEELKDDHHSGAGVLALIALESLRDIVKGEDLRSVNSTEEFWRELRMAAWHLAKNGRPSMSTAIETAISEVMETVIVKLPNPEAIKSVDLSTLKSIVERSIEARIAKRRHRLQALGDAFEDYIVRIVGQKRGKDNNTTPTVTIFTLSSSSTISRCITQLIQNAASNSMTIKLCILESRPLFEGVSFATSLLTTLDTEQRTSPSSPDISRRLQIEISADASLASVARTADFVVIGADKVSPAGDVSNKIGSLAAAVSAKTLQPSCKVVVVCETDKIACEDGELEDEKGEWNDAEEITGAWPAEYKASLNERRGRGFRVEVRNAYFEWVPERYVDVYVTEEGLLEGKDIVGISRKKKELEEKIFGNL
jgi:translation initiation factor 2B subunit (eIF-2B alpha/beta/delta family)